MTAKVFGFAKRSSKQKAPKPSALQKSKDTPIIALSALLKLAEWCESHVNRSQGGELCPDKEVHPSPPRPVAQGVVPLDQLWTLLASERRQRVVRILVRVVAQQVAPPPGKEVDNERQSS